MDIGVGLPNTVPGAEGRTLVAWARRAEERGFSYYALGDSPEVAQGGYLRDYYGAAPWVDQLVQRLPRTP
jgi:hypothetical protein